MSATGNTLVLQSHREPLPGRWLEDCLESVRAWAGQSGFRYRYLDDELFERLAPALRERTCGQPVVAADLARLAALDEALSEGSSTVVWLDADTLVVDPARFHLPESSYALGREVWVQPGDDGRPKTYVKVHNAFLLFRAGNPFLDFYRHAAEGMVLRHQGAMVPQLVGPKLLTALHNLVQCPVAEHAAVLSPPVVGDLLAGGGRFLDAFRAHSRAAPAVVNLCASLVGREQSEAQVRRAMTLLLRDPGVLRPSSQCAV